MPAKISAQEFLRSRDCLAYGCANDAVDDGVCEEHRDARRARLAYRALTMREEGRSSAEIGLALGISRSYAASLCSDPDGAKTRVRKDGYRRPCPSCGTPMDGSWGRGSAAPSLCAACSAAAQHDARYWTRDKIIAAIRAFADAVGRPPLSTEWLYGGARKDLPPVPAELKGWPWTSEVLREFGRWADAIEAAGFPRPLVGRNVRFPISPRGERRPGSMPGKLEYVVLCDRGEGLREVGRSIAKSPTAALEACRAEEETADLEAKYFVVSTRILGVPYEAETRIVFSRNGRRSGAATEGGTS